MPNTRRIRWLQTTVVASMRTPILLLLSSVSILLTAASPMLSVREKPWEGLPKACLVQTIDTSAFDPPSPDPAGIGYISSMGALLISDSEVNEMPIFTGDNLFEVSLSGDLLGTASTVSFSGEPTGVTYDVAENRLFYSDDNSRRVFELDPGFDGQLNTADDIITSFDTRVFGSFDPEGVAFDSKHGNLFLLDGANAEVYRISPGANKEFDGQPPEGDDKVVHFDLAVLGMTDPEGIAYNPIKNRLIVVGQPDDMIIELSIGGDLIRSIDISAANAVNPAGVTFAPGSLDPEVMSIYIVDRLVDNGTDPNENDGKVYEMTIPSRKPPKGVASGGCEPGP